MPASRACAREGARERGERDSPSLGWEDTMKKYRIEIVVKADSEDDAEYMARDMCGAAYDSVLKWRVVQHRADRKRKTAPKALARCGGA